MNDFTLSDSSQQTAGGRRRFLKHLTGGAAAGGALMVAGCDDDSTMDSGMDSEEVMLDFSNDFGVLNYAYALEQLEAAFYAEVVANLDDGTLDSDDSDLGEYFRDTVAHETIHREFLKRAISANDGTPIRGLTPNFSDVDFSSRDEVLSTAQTFEDLGVSAYNGAGQYISNPTYLTLAGKIVSVEARHAATIRDLIDPFSTNFADLNTDNGLDLINDPRTVLQSASSFIQDTVTVSGL